MTTNKKIIMVDDDEDLLKLVKTAFHTKGYEVKTFAKGKEGLDFILNHKNMTGYCLIILDRMLPDMDGLDILKSYMSSSKHEIPVLILSVLSSEKDVLLGLKKGAVDYVPKPFSLPVLMQKALSLIKG
jgi:DNA-binding response OmpR family regulator